MKRIELPLTDAKQIIEDYYNDIKNQRTKPLLWSDWRTRNIKGIWYEPCPEGPTFRYGDLNGDNRNPLGLLLTGTTVHGSTIGSTGSGKSVTTNFKYHDLCYRISPEHLELYMIDAKRVEFSKYAQDYKLPHAKVVAATSDMEYVITLGEWFVEQMDERNNLLSSIGASNVTDYYEATGIRLPTRMLVIDELGEFLSVCTNNQMKRFQNILSAVVRLGRNTQYFIDFATQVVPPQLDKTILSNFGIKFCLKVNDPKIGELALGNDASYYIKQRGFGYLNVGDGTKETNQLVRIPYISDTQFQANLKEMCEEADKRGIKTSMFYYNEKQVKPWNSNWEEIAKASPNKFLLGHSGQYIHEQWYNSFDWEYTNASNVLCFSPHMKASDVMLEMLVRNLNTKIEDKDSIYVVASNFNDTEKLSAIHDKVANYEITNDFLNSETLASLSKLLEGRKLLKAISNFILISRQSPDSLTINQFAEYAERGRNKDFFTKPFYENGEPTAQFDLEIRPFFEYRFKLATKDFTLSPIYIVVLGAEAMNGLGLSATRTTSLERFLLEAGNFGIKTIIQATQLAEGKQLYKKVCKYKMCTRLSETLSGQLDIQKGEAVKPQIGLLEDSMTGQRWMFKLLAIEGEATDEEEVE